MLFNSTEVVGLALATALYADLDLSVVGSTERLLGLDGWGLIYGGLAVEGDGMPMGCVQFVSRSSRLVCYGRAIVSCRRTLEHSEVHAPAEALVREGVLESVQLHLCAPSTSTYRCMSSNDLACTVARAQVCGPV